MKIERLTFERYGIFTDRALSFDPGAMLHVVLGGNEAGKTSALSAIGDLLFGFGGRTDYDFRHDGKTLRIGGAFRHSDGRLIEARRRKGNKNTLIDDADQPLPDDFLAPILGGVSRETFSREFGLTAEALRLGGDELVKAGGRLAETLAASSATMTALSRIKDRLKDEADELFTARRSGSKPFYLAAERRNEADKTLRDAIVTREALQQLQAAVQEARAGLEDLNAQHGQSGVTLARWQRTLRVRSKLARLESIGVELVALADLPAIPTQSIARWRDALADDTALGRELSELDAADASDAEAIAAMAVDERLLSEGVAIDALRERLGAVRKAIDDLPRRRQARDAAEAALNEAARRLGVGSHVALLEKLPTDPALAHANDLIDKFKHGAQALADAEARHSRAQQERAAFESEEGQAPLLVDSEQLRQRFEALGDIPAQVDRLRRERADLKTEADTLSAAAASLDPSPGTIEALRTLPLPDQATINKHVRAVDLIETEVKRLGDMLRAADTAIAKANDDIAALSRSGAVSTRADLIAARTKRDSSFETARAALGSDRLILEMQLMDVERASHVIDRLTDQLLTDTERATRLDDAQQRLAASRLERDQIELDLQSQQRQLFDVKDEWISCWKASGITPRSPSEMLRWRERIEDISSRLGKLDTLSAGIDAQADAIEAGKSAVIAFLDHAGRVADRALPPEILFREAKSRFGELQAAWTEAKARSLAKQKIERDLSDAETARNGAVRALDELRLAWPGATAGLGLATEATLAQAIAALGVWQSVLVPRTNYEREGRSVETIEADIAAFDRDVFDVMDRVAASLKSSSAQETLARLSAKLEEMRRASEACVRLRKAGVQRSVHRRTLVAKRTALAEVLDDACRLLGIADGGLPETIERLSLRQRLEEERAGLHRELHEIGDGRDESALREEQEGLDLDLLPGEIEREKLRQNQLLTDITEASAFHHQEKSELDELLKGRDAAGAATERAEANAELLSIAERWLMRAAASRLATRAIEKHRALVQDPLIARAGQLFATATDGAFSGLATDYGDDDQPVLKAQRATGERVEVGGLSEGTRDQLFLALRLSLLERGNAEPMPFIGDDLLTSFDESRTLATLRLLAVAGGQRQIILFTHHRHVVDLAKTVQGHRIDFIDLSDI